MFSHNALIILQKPYISRVLYFAVFPMNVSLLKFNFTDSELLQCTVINFVETVHSQNSRNKSHAKFKAFTVLMVSKLYFYNLAILHWFFYNLAILHWFLQLASRDSHTISGVSAINTARFPHASPASATHSSSWALLMAERGHGY